MEALWELLLARSAQRTLLVEAVRVVQARRSTTMLMELAVTRTFTLITVDSLATTPGQVTKTHTSIRSVDTQLRFNRSNVLHTSTLSRVDTEIT